MDDPVTEILGQHEFDGTAWKELHRVLQSSLAVLPTCEVHAAIDFPKSDDPKDKERAMRQVLEGMGEGHVGCFRAILYSIREHEWPALSDQEVFHLTVCLDQMVAFLEQCFVEIDGRCLSLFPYSKQSEDALVLWMFWRWWLEGGLMRFVRQAATDRSLYDRYFVHP
jgi:hypothetical protein